MKIHTRTNLLSMSVAILAISGQAQAIPILSVSNNAGETIILSDGSALDAHPTDGAVTFVGKLTGWDIVVSTGLSGTALGASTLPVLHLDSIVASSTGGGTLTVSLTDTDFIGGSEARSSLSIGGFTTGSVSYRGYYDDSNADFGTSSLLGLIGPLSGAFSASMGSPFSPGGLYSLTQVVEITHRSGGFQHSSFNAVISVPEPGTLALLGLGLLVLGASRWSWRSPQKA